MSEYPEILHGGCLPLAWQLKDKRVVLVGGGVVAAGRLVNVLQADALVTLIAPSKSLNAEVKYRIMEDPLAASRITYVDRLYEGPSDLEGADMVLTAIDDNEASLKIWNDAKTLRIPVNVADVPPNCDFYFGSLIRRGPLQVLVSTNGRGPKLASLIRHKLESALPPHLEQAIDKVGTLRERLRERAPGVGGRVGRDRMKWMTEVCEVWDMEELADLDDAAMQKLLDQGWETKKVPDYRAIMGRKSPSKASAKQWNFSGMDFTLGVMLGIGATITFTTWWARRLYFTRQLWNFKLPKAESTHPPNIKKEFWSTVVENPQSKRCPRSLTLDG
ncbi:siroheme synthase [Serendipita vermifera]|nr:siroheme synthase [Serendipita vermifera]